MLDVIFIVKTKVEFKQDIVRIAMPYDIFETNDKALRADFDLLTEGRKSQAISDTVNVLGKEDIFLEEGAKVEFATLGRPATPRWALLVAVNAIYVLICYANCGLPTDLSIMI